MDIKVLLRKYKIYELKCFKKYCDYFGNICDLDFSIVSAVKSIDHTGKMSLHQRRIGGEVLSSFIPYLQALRSEIELAENFEDLYRLVRNARLKFRSDGHRRIGELCVYDFAFRICCYLDEKNGRQKGRMFPNSVYLHADPRKSAVALGWNVRGGAISISDLPDVFRESGLNSAEIENFLCVYCDDLMDGGA